MIKFDPDRRVVLGLTTLESTTVPLLTKFGGSVEGPLIRSSTPLFTKLPVTLTEPAPEILNIPLFVTLPETAREPPARWRTEPAATLTDEVFETGPVIFRTPAVTVVAPV